ncbi:TetR/AcrR family transcriptional regulator [Rhodococcus sp. X156]|uniref:TetR/AcrR family transcriptional regulator n=1 Tax=Rhodococcus sp. X156 TaxID=2499145 RepID=UPI000FD93B35|nr:TetR/AcrR family transcriptional regulator [Rhodococcus sp. X156]
MTSAAATAAAVVDEARSARVAIDGRKKRWDEHKRARREEFVDGALAAIRRNGPQIGMEDIAGELQVSKTVLYRHFTDKSDLVDAILTRIAQTVALPPLLAELSQERADFDQARALIGAYVRSVAAEPELYGYVFTHNQEVGGAESVVATTERVIAEALSGLVGDRLRTMGMDSGGAQPWAYGVVGMVQLATHWWLDNRTMSSDALVDYLSMLVWGGLEGVLRADGAPAKFVPAAASDPTRRLLGGPLTPDPAPDPDADPDQKDSHG